MDGPLLLYDGTCGFCARNIQFVLTHERTHRSLRFARSEGAFGQRFLEENPGLSGSMVWHEPAVAGRSARMLVRSDAAIAELRYLGGGWAMLGSLLALVPRVIRDAGYKFIARHRHRLADNTVCVVPTPEQRSRFLDPPA